MEKVLLNGKTYELPKKTLAVAQKIEELTKIVSGSQAGEVSVIDTVTAQFDFLVDLMGENKVCEILGTSDINEADINEIAISVLHIFTEYNRPLIDAKLKNASAQLNRADLRALSKTAKEMSSAK